MSVGDWTQNEQFKKQYEAMQQAQLNTSGTTGVTWTTNAASLGALGTLNTSTYQGHVAAQMQPANGWRVVTWQRPSTLDEPVEVQVRPIIGFVYPAYSTELTYVWADGAQIRQGDQAGRLGASRVLTLLGPDEVEERELWQSVAQKACDREVANEAAERLAPTPPTDEELKKAWTSGYAKLVAHPALATQTTITYGSASAGATNTIMNNSLSLPQVKQALTNKTLTNQGK